MQVGDLVKYISHSTNGALGIVLRTPEQTNNGDALVCFSKTIRRRVYKDTMYCRGNLLEVVYASGS
jgi:putative AlgH/UPF0301 family transcriptional regulator